MSTPRKMFFFSFLKVLFLNLKSSFFRLYEEGCVWIRYYPRRPSFAWIDFLLTLQYLWKSPHRISKQFLKERGAQDIYVYGETPLTTLDRISKECRILSQECVYELGSGTGRTAFWLQQMIGCSVVGIDHLPLFIQRADRVKKWTHTWIGERIVFKAADFSQIDLSKATLIYLYGTCLTDQEIEQLMQQFFSLKPGIKVISVSYPLTAYSNACFKLLKEFSCRFPWGSTEVYLQERI